MWWLETIGGHHWIARRVPDDVYVVMPNQLGLDSFDLTDALGEQKEYMCSADLAEFIAKNHLDLSQDGALNPRDAFGSHDDSDHVYNTPRAWWMLRHLNAFPISRGTGDQRSLNYAIRLVEEGKVLGIFPEGTRSKDPDGKMLPPKAGIALIAKATHADVLPACIYFEGKSKFRKKITVRFGEVIPYEELGLTDESNMSEIKDASRLVMGKIGELLEKGHEKD